MPANTSDPNSFSMQWPISDRRSFQLVNERGTTGLLFRRYKDGELVGQEQVQDPGRFGMDHAPKSYDEFRVVTNRWMREWELNTQWAKANTIVHRER